MGPKEPAYLRWGQARHSVKCTLLHAPQSGVSGPWPSLSTAGCNEGLLYAAFNRQMTNTMETNQSKGVHDTMVTVPCDAIDRLARAHAISQQLKPVVWDPRRHDRRSLSLKRNGKLWAELEKNALSNFVDSKDQKQRAERGREDQQAPGRRSAQQDWVAALGERWARTLYAYFNYRTGSVNDLQLLIILNVSIILIGGALRHYLVVKDLPTGAAPTLGQDLYRVRTCMVPSAFRTASKNCFLLSCPASPTSDRECLCLPGAAAAQLCKWHARAGGHSA